MDPYAHYRQQAASTASPAQLVLMLYDGALAEISRAQLALTAPADGSAAHEALSRAQRIVLELTVTLDHERGGDVAANLAQLYGYVTDRLVEANVAKDATPLSSATGVLRDLRDAWAQACVGAVPVAG